MKKAVLWSGGLDSTYLIYKNLKEGHTVDAHYVDIENNDNKTKMELKAIDKLNKLFNKEFSNFNYKGTLLRVSVTGVACYDNLIFKQLPTWIYALQWIGYVDCIEIGYVINDDAISYIEDIRKIYNSFSSIKDIIIPIEFPLTKVKKEDEYYNPPEEYRKYLERN